MERTQRVVFVDNYDAIRLRTSEVRRLLSILAAYSGQVVLFANDLTQQVNEIMGASPGGEVESRFQHFRIMPYGHVRREELAERWFALDPDVAENPERFAARLVEAKRVTDIAIGKSFVPSYPVFLLTLLQAQDQGQQLNLSSSTYGYFYELLITASLALGARSEAIDVRMSFLSYFAFEMFSSGILTLKDHELRRICQEFEKDRLLQLSYSKLTNELVKANILELRGDDYCFKYKYIYYYFVARYMSDHITETRIREIIERLAGELHREEPANILLFLTHLSKDPVIIQCLVARAETIFPDSPRAELRQDQSPFPEIENSLKNLVYEDHGSTENRRRMLERMDSAAQAGVTNDMTEGTRDEVGEAHVYLEKMGAALKTTQLLGQILKNFPGSLDGPTKETLVRQCYNVSLRLLGSILESIKTYPDDFVNQIAAVLEERAELDEEQLRRRVRRALVALTFIASYAIVRRVSYSVGSPDLLPVYKKVHAEDDVPAVQLITAALQLEQQGTFPEEVVVRLHELFEGNYLADLVLRQLVMTHFHLFSVPFGTKQRVCAKLEIEYRRVIGANPVTKLIAAPQKS